MNIITGSLKGRRIPFPFKKFPEAQITPSKVKEAVFSILGEDLSKMNFLDLFAGSGQIGLEALSRGASFTLFNDIDASNTRFIGEILRSWGLDNRSTVLHMPAKQCLRYCAKKGFLFDIAYVDPPYDKIKGKNHHLSHIIEDIAHYDIFTGSATVVIQHYYANILPENILYLSLTKVRTYGTSALSVYEMRK